MSRLRSTRTELCLAFSLAGCATTGGEVPRLGVGECRDAPAQRFVGQVATAALGGEMLRVSGAKILRWGPPGAMMTMDYRTDRLTVSYDRAMRITSARCG